MSWISPGIPQECRLINFIKKRYRSMTEVLAFSTLQTSDAAVCDELGWD